MHNKPTETAPERRTFLKQALAATSSAAGLVLPMSSLASQPAATASQGGHNSNGEARTLSLYNLHTAEGLNITYRVDDQYLEPCLNTLNYLLRDHRQDEATVMDARLFDQLWELQQKLGKDTVFEIISGYRTPKTNAMLRARSKKVASKSYHMLGRAVDIRARDLPTRVLYRQALALKSGGAGYYPRSSFVHIDTGPVRTWRS